jgi:opacity protein-like surface antigen
MSVSHLWLAPEKDEAMVSVKFFASVAAASLVGTAAYAADMQVLPPPPPPPMYQPPPVAYQPPVMAAPVMSGWYLRGDVGVGMQTFGDFTHTQTNSAFVWPASWTIVQKDVQDTAIFGGGVGYEWNNWFRTDFTAEYRTKAGFRATGRFFEFCAGGGACFDVTDGHVSSSVFMANAYLDLGTWWCLTPYIGAGFGGAWNRVTDVQDLGVNSSGTVGFGFSQSDATNWNFAWNAQAGLTYNVSNSFKVDLSARYLHLGSPQTAEVFCQNTPACPGASFNLSNMNSWDFRIGLRWMLQPDIAPMIVAPPPLMSRG